jgi:hypothetical protein
MEEEIWSVKRGTRNLLKDEEETVIQQVEAGIEKQNKEKGRRLIPEAEEEVVKEEAMKKMIDRIILGMREAGEEDRKILLQHSYSVCHIFPWSSLSFSDIAAKSCSLLFC